MFSWLKKNRTVRSILAVFALGSASASLPKSAEGAPSPAPITQSVSTESLRSSYLPFCKIVEGDTPLVYNDVGMAATACGVRLKYHANDSWTILKITPKSAFSFRNTDMLRRIADADWKNQKVANLKKFSMLKNVEFVTVKDVKDIKGADLPSSCAKNWTGVFYLSPASTVKKASYNATLSAVNEALACHPNLFKLPPATQWVVIDLVHNCGRVNYKKKHPKFFAAVQSGRLDLMRTECTVKDPRRDALKQGLITASIVAKLDADEARSYEKFCSSPGINFEKLKTERFLGFVRECLKKECEWSRLHPISKVEKVSLLLAESQKKPVVRPTKAVPVKNSNPPKSLRRTLSRFNVPKKGNAASPKTRTKHAR
ncbi:MAG: hypothetical protein IKQ99_02810 [Alphaproteobacteria bacterium]|nr:hypothetical protein [Alphaproteobacteria bacterium]